MGPGVSLPSLWPRYLTGACPTAIEVTSYLVDGWGRRSPRGAKTTSLSQNSGDRSPLGDHRSHEVKIGLPVLKGHGRHRTEGLEGLLGV